MEKTKCRMAKSPQPIKDFESFDSLQEDVLALEENDQDLRQLRQFSLPSVSVSNESASLPIIQNEMGMIIIPVKIHGRDYHFMLDTGAQSSIIIQSVFQSLDIDPSKSLTLPVGSSSGEKNELPLCILSRIAISNITVNELPVMIMPDESLSIPHESGRFQISGIIGWDILRQVNLSINIMKHEIIINPDIKDLPHEKNFFNSVFPAFMAFDKKEEPIVWGIDSGARLSWLDKEGKIVQGEENKTVFMNKARGFQGEYETEEVMIEKTHFQLGHYDIYFDNISTGFTDFIPEFRFDGVIGSDVLGLGTAYFISKEHLFYIK